MNETTYVYIVHSDINENNIYAEFATEEEAIEYARRNKDELTYVDKVEVALDENGEIIEMFDSETIWVYDDEAELSVEEDDDYWNQLAAEESDRKEAEHLLGDTSWFEGLDTDALVETLEENEDIVECKECFELFPKEACTKIAIGYICPECGKIHNYEESEFDIDSIPNVAIADEDTFKIDFPELERTNYGNDMIPDIPTPEIENDPISEPECVGSECEAPVEAPVTKDETITKLVVDEHEAIDGYEKAKIEIEANSELDEKEKEEILDTIEHIKEEEIEHIEELEELVDEVEETKAEEPAEESESEDKSEVLVEGSGFFGKIILDDYFKKDGERNPENKNGTGYWVDLYDPDTKQSILKPADKKVFQTLKEAEKFASNLSIAEGGWALIKVENAQGWNGILEVYEKGKRIKDVSQTKLDTLNKAWEDQEKRKKARQAVDKQAGKDDTKETEIKVEEDQPVEDGTPVEEKPKEPKNAAAVKASKEYKKILSALKKIGIDVSKLINGKKPTPSLKELRKLLFTESLEEHVNEEHPAIESDQVLVGTDNAVVDCKVNKVITHSEDEKPVDCEGKKKPLEKPLTESTTKNILDMVKDTVDSRGYDTWIYDGSGYISYCIEIIKDGDEYKANEYISTESGAGDTDPEFIYSNTDFRDVIKFLLDEGYFDKEDPRDSQDISRTDAEGYLRNLTEATHAQVAKPEGSRTLAYNNALTYAKKANKPYIFGYTNHTGKFFALDLPLKVTGRPVDAEKEFRNKYKNSKVVYIAYPDKEFITESLVESIEDDLIKAYDDVIAAEKELKEIEKEIWRLRDTKRTELNTVADYSELRKRLNAVNKEINELRDTYERWEIVNDDWDHDLVVFDREKEEELAPKIKELSSIYWDLWRQVNSFEKEVEDQINNDTGSKLKDKQGLVSTAKTVRQTTLEKYLDSEKQNILKAFNYINIYGDCKLNLKRATFNRQSNTVFIPVESFVNGEIRDWDGELFYSDDEAKEFAEDYLMDPSAIAEELKLNKDEAGNYIIPESNWKLLSEADWDFELYPESEEDDEATACLTCYLVKTVKSSSNSVVENFKFTKAEQEEYNMDEDGNSLDSYDTYVRCGWCGEIFTKAECVFEKDFGWLCDRCQDELKSHGGHLDIIVDPTEEDIERAENNK